MRKSVYTAILGGYDELKTPSTVTNGWDYICFTDDPSLKSNFWDVILIDKLKIEKQGAKFTDNPRRLAKFFKMFPDILLPDYAETFWIDASFEVVGNIDEFINKYLDNKNMLCFIHPLRNCAYKEAYVCVENGLALNSVVKKQMARYRGEGFPENYGLIASGILYRRHTPELSELNLLWYSETMSGASRDQLSFNYCCFKTGFKYSSCNLNYWNNPYFIFKNHKRCNERFDAKLYIETYVRPFSEETAVREVLGFPDSVFEIHFKLDCKKEQIKQFRFDPCDAPLVVKINSALLIDNTKQGKAIHLECTGTNSTYKDDGFYIFTHNDPNIFFEYPQNKLADWDEVCFEGEIKILDKDKTRKFLRNLMIKHWVIYIFSFGTKRKRWRKMFETSKKDYEVFIEVLSQLPAEQLFYP